MDLTDVDTGEYGELFDSAESLAAFILSPENDSEGYRFLRRQIRRVSVRITPMSDRYWQDMAMRNRQRYPELPHTALFTWGYLHTFNAAIRLRDEQKRG